MTQETISVRRGEELPMDSLESYLRAHIPEMDPGELVVEQFSAGHSNLTYLVKCGSWEAVLRRPPLGPVAPKAHDMVRECQLLSALHPVFPLAPRPYLVCQDNSLLGAPFFVMERRNGVVADRVWPDEYPKTPENGRTMAEAVVDTLARLHSVDYLSTPLAQLGHPDGYLERQVSGLIQRYARAQTEDVPEASEVGRWMVAHLPVSPAPTFIHNDLKLNNMLLDETDAGRVTAVVDWEMATVGDPLSDLAITLSYWSEAEDPAMFQRLRSPLTTSPGFLTRAELIELYARKTGRNVDSIDYYLVFAYFKAAVICQQIYYRFAQGQTQDQRFATMGAMATNLVCHALNVASKVRD